MNIAEIENAVEAFLRRNLIDSETSQFIYPNITAHRILTDERKIISYIEKAYQGDSFSIDVLKHVTQWISRSDLKAPQALLKYLADEEPKRKPGVPYEKHELRNITITQAVKLALDSGLKLTRNETTTGRHSACSFVAEIINDGFKLNIDEDRIRKIYKSWIFSPTMIPMHWR